MHVKLTFRVYCIKYAIIYEITYTQIHSKTPYIIYVHYEYII